MKPWIKAKPAGYKLVNARVVDPASSALLAGLQQVVIVDGRFVAVQGMNKEVVDFGELKVVDLEGRFLCPCVIQVSLSLDEALLTPLVASQKEVLSTAMSTLRPFQASRCARSQRIRRMSRPAAHVF